MVKNVHYLEDKDRRRARRNNKNKDRRRPNNKDEDIGQEEEF